MAISYLPENGAFDVPMTLNFAMRQPVTLAVAATDLTDGTASGATQSAP